ncbi:molybdopterin-dependent oxidoreductase [Kibdelosporangium phytohabitans]|uniref:Molybdopterin-binding oxidoreductase n=1 Tax=Kibdelosporangium phytohabitans TaxID=860235 RepID=A0A0N7F4C2_9PSEU|nr:molybdopterin-dependent oxidoreductase [Kibdelosporangium phytohabitans]ALG11023.1 molybdopterin-binding oxidoreductase [Kibdelosporangium phytohabitans]MBE1462248.1 anaerobic selenocysteine-containing dehydrogenase [Kibdelosporangium phytohabitans]
MPTTHFRTCPLCEATCGLKITVDGDRVTDVRGDKDDVFSLGFICPKGAKLGDLDQDPDRLRGPLVKRDGQFAEVSWEEAFAEVERGLAAVRAAHGNDSVALYLGNPSVHAMAGPVFNGVLAKALGTRNVYTASTSDQMPKHVSCGYLFGDPYSIPVPDIDRTDHLLMLGANPLESNGSLCTAPDFPGRLKALRARGGRFVVVDPRRTRTADLADEHLFIRPGADAVFLFALVHTLFDENLTADVPDVVRGVEELRVLASKFTPETVATACGIDAGTIRQTARDLAAAPAAAVYARIGTTTAEFGTLSSWLVDALNVLTGNLDRPGGAMFPSSATRATYVKRKPFRTGRWASRVRGLPEALGELPTATLPDEIETPGEGQVRALVTVAGNPASSAPNAARFGAALADLEFMVCVDPYLNETTRHATVILPPPRVTQSPHFDFGLTQFGVRNFANYSSPALPLPDGRPSEAEILARLALIAAGQGASADPRGLEEMMLGGLLAKAVKVEGSPVYGRDPAELRPLIDGDGPLERFLDLSLRLGPYGEGFGVDESGLRLTTLLANPHGVDLGALRPRLTEVLSTADGKLQLCPPEFAADVPRLLSWLADRPHGMVLIGRRHLRSNNSWMHNVPALVTGSNTCTLHINPQDAEKLAVGAGQRVLVMSRTGSVEVAVEPTDKIMPGVVSLPHGWGHDQPGVRMSVAGNTDGVNVNTVTDESVLDVLSGTAVFNGVPVELKVV